MKRIIEKKILRESWEIHADSEQYLKTWYEPQETLIRILRLKLNKPILIQVY